MIIQGFSLTDAHKELIALIKTGLIQQDLLDLNYKLRVNVAKKFHKHNERIKHEPSCPFCDSETESSAESSAEAVLGFDKRC